MKEFSVNESSYVVRRESLVDAFFLVAWSVEGSVVIEHPRAIFWRNDGKVTIQGARTVTIPQPETFEVCDFYGDRFDRDGAF